MTVTYLITGASRGIGFALAKELSQNPENIIFATARDPTRATELAELAKNNKQVHVVTLDVADQTSVEALDDQILRITDTIDVLISNAGISADMGSILKTSRQEWANIYNVNTIGAVMVVRQLHKFLAKSKLKHVVLVSSQAGAFSLEVTLPVNAYGPSKAALNFANTILHNELKGEGFTFVALSPGVVSTEMGKLGFSQISELVPDAVALAKDATNASVITPEESASAIVKLLANIDSTYGGKFYNFDGSELQY